MRTRNQSSGRTGVLAAAALAAVVASGCEVINPGPVTDEFIALPASQQGLVNGSWERMNQIIGRDAYDLALPAREIFHGGQTGSYGHNTSTQAGSMGGWGSSGPYNASQQARWIAEEAIRQFEVRDDVPPNIMAEAYLAAGYANRINGDFFCWGVIDGGPIMEGSHYWERAVGHFTDAIAAAPDNDTRYAALAGRAQAHLALENWQQARDDAQEVPDDFEFHIVMDFSASGDTGQRNHVYFANADNPFRSYTVRFTFFDDYYRETGDPRTPWRFFTDPEAATCVGALQGYGPVPCTQQQKYTTGDDDIRLASGAEMRLVEAETILRMTPGDWQTAMDIINANRTRYTSNPTLDVEGTHEGGTPLEPWVADNLDDAWTYLMRERGIELWLEARRFTDMRRWEPYIVEYGTLAEDGQTPLPLEPTTPGTLDWPDFESQFPDPENNLFTQSFRGRSAIEDQSLPRELCYNISGTERDTNPNFDDDGHPIGGDPILP